MNYFLNKKFIKSYRFDKKNTFFKSISDISYKNNYIGLNNLQLFFYGDKIARIDMVF